MDEAARTKLLALVDPRFRELEPSNTRLNEPRGQSVGKVRAAAAVSSPARGPAVDVRPLSTPAGQKYVKLSNHVITQVDDRSDFSSMVRKVSIDRLNEESKKIRGHQTPLHPAHALGHAELPDELAEMFIRRLLQPNISQEMVEARFSSMAAFSIPREHVLKLIIKSIDLIKRESMVLHLRAPIKVFGDIHGQYYDMMRLFGSYRCPVDEAWFAESCSPELAKVQGDIDSTDYLFLGDFVDRGCNSLEVICLLLALKCRSPRQIHLIRGNHEDAAINGTYGFKDECRRRLGEDPDQPGSCWNLFNMVFEYLPLGAVIEDRIFCIHGGIGGNVNTVDDVASLGRPLKVSQLPTTLEEQKVTDLLWSDPTENDSQVGVIPNDVRDPENTGHITRYGPDRVVEFLEGNNLDLIIRAHECVMDGFERFAAGRLITLFSATDYCNTHKNAGALLYVRKDLTIVPKMIYPASRDVRSTWLTLDARPPTPPRSSRRVKSGDEWQY
ncbi:serine/threonine-protein phosphatase [Gregarina niphandrodes]|uniref:Serine/threonine-protein phosphatase n=1 Tax=Gregarina niphandrodes TaxID=110365 RepID=A0A023BAR4_GRENI|nr:serine/threonine-protein phosphatase [Gregarina niphandrodes]EZG78507.1 serine/threonine-protein phosphatase [Gregarina niphandrodes]|eukprot:XP_011129274.1 serine/threonine-protein phosphatase [Gregarina niphandrodes]